MLPTLNTNSSNSFHTTSKQFYSPPSIPERKEYRFHVFKDICKGEKEIVPS